MDAKKQNKSENKSDEKPVKSESDRIAECVQIRQQLQQLGALIHDRNRKRLAEATNTFVRGGTGMQFRLPVENGVAAIVTLRAREDTQSGITLERN